MKVEIKVNEIDVEASHKLGVVKNLASQIASFFEKKDYGGGVKSVLIICILIKTRPGYEKWYKIRRPKFTEYAVWKNKKTELKIVVEKEFVYEIRIDNEDYDDFISLSDEYSRKILASEILDSISNLDSLPKKVKNFDKERFKDDMQLFFHKEGLT